MAQPSKGSNIGFLWREVLTDKPLTMVDIRDIITKNHSSFPIYSTTVHLKELIKRGYAFESINDAGVKEYYKCNQEIPNKENKRTPKHESYNILKRFFVSQVNNPFTVKEISAATGLDHQNLSRTIDLFVIDKHVIKARISNRIRYTAMQSIIDNNDNGHATQVLLPVESLGAPPTTDLSNMTITDIMTTFMALRDENTRLKHGLSTITQSLITMGIIDNE